MLSTLYELVESPSLRSFIPNPTPPSPPDPHLPTPHSHTQPHSNLAPPDLPSPHPTHTPTSNLTPTPPLDNSIVYRLVTTSLHHHHSPPSLTKYAISYVDYVGLQASSHDSSNVNVLLAYIEYFIRGFK